MPSEQLPFYGCLRRCAPAQRLAAPPARLPCRWLQTAPGRRDLHAQPMMQGEDPVKARQLSSRSGARARLGATENPVLEHHLRRAIALRTLQCIANLALPVSDGRPVATARADVRMVPAGVARPGGGICSSRSIRSKRTIAILSPGISP
jgi:hypothetical protein